MRHFARVGVLSCGLICAGFPSLSLRAEAPQRSWQVVVRPFDTTGRPTWVWIGLRNRTDKPRAFCRLGVTYGFDLPNGDTRFESPPEYPSRGSPHPCGLDDGTLVLPGETHFAKIRLVLPADALVKKGIRYEITAEEACVADNDCRHSPIVVMQE